jgi:hypothetical protein
MNADGTNQRNLTNNALSSDQDPAWSPDGTKIAFFTGAPSTHVFVMNADGSGQTQPSSRGAAFPDWQPETAFSAPVLFSSAGQLATITVPLEISTGVGILVQRRVRGRLVRVGRVPLGRRRKGRNRIRWNLRVRGRRLRPGIYFVRVRLLNRRGRVFEVSKPFRLRVRARARS